MAQPGILSSQIPPGEDHVMRALADIRREMRELGPSMMHSFQSVVDELAAHQATLDAQQATLATTVSDLTTAQATLATTVSDLTTAQADIAANVASINDLLTKVVRTDAIFASASNFSLSTSSATKVSLTITVPAGFTKAAVSVIGRVFAINNNTTGGPAGTGLDYLYADARIAGFVGNGMPLVANGSNGSAMNVAPFAKVLTGLTPGDTFTILVNAATSYLSWAAQASNKADLSGTISWYR